MTIYLLIYLSIVNVIMNKHFSWAPTTDKLLKLSKNISLKLFKNKYNLSCFKIYCKLLKRKRFLKSIKALFGLKYLQWHGNIYRIYIYKFYKTFPKPLWHLVTLHFFWALNFYQWDINEGGKLNLSGENISQYCMFLLTPGNS